MVCCVMGIQCTVSCCIGVALSGASGFSNWQYTLSYGPVGDPQVTPNTTYGQNFFLSGLQPGSLYQFSVSVTGLSPVNIASAPYVFATSKTGKT